VNNWEHGKRYPVGEAKALLKVLDRLPEKVLAVLSYSKTRSNPTREGSQGEAPQRVLYFNLWRV